MKPADGGNTPKPAPKKVAPVGSKKATKKLFNDPELQAMYEKLVTGGNVRTTNAINMGPIPDYVGVKHIAKETVKKGGALSPEVAKLLKQVEKADEETRRLGGTKKHEGPGLLNRTIDVLSRGLYASANAFQDNIERGQKAHEGNPLDPDRLAAGFKGFWEGLSGKEKTTFGTLREEAGVDHGKWGNFAQDLFLDIFADPTTYIGVSAMKGGVRLLGSAVGKTGKAVDKATEVSRELSNIDRVVHGAQQAAKNADQPIHSAANIAPREARWAVDDPGIVKVDAPKLAGATDAAAHVDRTPVALVSSAPQIRGAAQAMVHEGDEGWIPMPSADHVFVPETTTLPKSMQHQLEADVMDRYKAFVAKQTGKHPSNLNERNLAKSPQYRAALDAATKKAAAEHYKGIKVRNAQKGKFEYKEEFPLESLKDVHPQVLQDAEDEVIIRFENGELDKFGKHPSHKGKSVQHLARDVDGSVHIKTPGTQFFHELPAHEQLQIMENAKPKIVEEILAAQKTHGLWDDAADFTRAAVEETPKVVPTAAEKAVGALVAKAIVAEEKATVTPTTKIVESTAKPRKYSYSGIKGTERALDEPLDEIEMGIASETAKLLSAGVEANNFNAKFSNNINKLFNARSTASQRLMGKHKDGINKVQRRLAKSEAHKARTLMILAEAVRMTGIDKFVKTPSGTVVDLLNIMARIPAADLSRISKIEDLLTHPGATAQAKDIANSVLDHVARAKADPNIGPMAVKDLADNAPRAVEQAVVDATGSASVAVGAGKATEESVKAIQNIDPISSITNKLADARAQYDSLSDSEKALVGKLEDKIEQLGVDLQIASFRYLGIRIGWGVNPLLEIPIVRIGKKGERAAKQAVTASTAAKTYHDVTSLTAAVKAAPYAFAVAFRNGYGFSPALHEVRMSMAGQLRTRTAVLGRSLGLSTRHLSDAEKQGAYLAAMRGESMVIKGVDYGQDYAKLMDEMVDQTIKRAGLSDDAVAYELKFIRPSPGAPPLEIPFEGLNWRQMGREGIEEGKLDPNRVGMAIITAVQRAHVNKLQDDQIKALFGTSVDAQALRAKAGRLAGARTLKDSSNIPPTMKGVLFPEEMATQIERHYELLNDLRRNNLKKIGPLLRIYDIMLGKWKAGVTVYNPAFHERNLMGDIFTGFLDGVGPRSYSKSARVLNKHFVRNGEEVPEEFLLAGGYDARRIFDVGSMQDTIVDSTKTITKIEKRGKSVEITAEDYMREFLQRGLRQEIASSEMLTEIAGARRATQRAGAKARKWSEGREDWPRMAHFIEATERGLKRGMTKEEAFAYGSRQSKKFHADYGDLTPFEQNVMRRVVPFYTWQRRMMPVILENLLVNPGKMAVPTKVMRDMSAASGFPVYDENKSFPQVEAVVPQWMRYNMMWPQGHHGENVVYADPGNPFHDMFKQTLAPALSQPIKTFMAQTTPFARVPLELSTGRQFFGSGTGIPINEGEKTLYADTQLPILSILGRMSNISPTKTALSLGPGGDPAGLVRNPKTGSPDEAGWNNVALMNTLLATGAAENTTRRKKGELRRQRQGSLAAKAKARDEYYRKRGKTPPKQRNT